MQLVMMCKGSSNSTKPSVDIKGRPANMTTSGRWRAVRFLIAAELLEKMAFLAVASNLITYLTRQLHEGAGTPSINVCNWLGASFFLAIVGGFIADAYWGRFWTMINFSCLYPLGILVLTLAETIQALKLSPCDVKGVLPGGFKCAKATSKEVGFVWLALVLVAILLGGTAPTRAPLSADQFSETDSAERRMLAAFSTCWFLSVYCNVLVAQSVIVYIQDNVGWGLGFGLPTAKYALAVVLMFCGIPCYRHHVPSGSPLTAIAQVLVAAARNRTPSNPNLHDNNSPSSRSDTTAAKPCHNCLEHSQQSLTAAVANASTVTEEHTTTTSFLDAEPAFARSSWNPSWKRCPRSQVEDVKQVVRLLPLWLVSIPPAAVQAQSVTFFTLQGHTLESRICNLSIPPTSLPCATTAAFLICVLMRGQVEERRVMTPLQRIGVSMLLSVLVMAVAATTEAKRLKEVQNHSMLDEPHQVVPMSILWLLQQYILTGLMEVFLTLGQLKGSSQAHLQPGKCALACQHKCRRFLGECHDEVCHGHHRENRPPTMDCEREHQPESAGQFLWASYHANRMCGMFVHGDFPAL